MEIVLGLMVGFMSGFLVAVVASLEMEKSRVKGEPFTLFGKIYKYIEVKSE